MGISGTIAIKDCHKSPQNIDLINPHTGNIWKRGEAHNIEWNNQFTKNKKVTIQLIKHPGKQLVKDEDIGILVLPTSTLFGVRSINDQHLHFFPGTTLF